MSYVSTSRPSAEDRLRQLLSAACDGPCDDSIAAELERLLADDHSLIAEYADYVATTTLLEQVYGLTVFDAEGRGIAEGPSPMLATRPDVASRRPRSAKPPSFLTYLPWVAAASLMAAFGVGLMQWTREPLARVVAANDARLANGRELSVGAGIGAKGLSLSQGSVRLALRSGAMISIDAPARLSVAGENAADLALGAVSIHVPVSAHGFRLASPAATIIDLGTGYRAVASDAGWLSVQVTQGSVRVVPTGGESVDLRAGQFTSVGAGAPRPPHKPAVSGQLRFLEEHVESLGYDAFIHDNRAYVFLESHAVRMPYDLRLDVSNPGRHVDLMSGNEKVTDGQVVDCYLIHSAPRSPRHVVNGSVRFDGRILGLLCEADRLNATNELLGARWTLNCRHPERGSESYPDPNADTVAISSDRHTLTVHFRTMSIDQIRVLVAP